MSHDINMLRAKLRKSLENIGRTNGHAMPPSTSNIDGVLHELFVTAEAMAYFKTRYDEAKDKALEVALAPGELEDIVTRVTDNMQGESVVCAEGDLYVMTMDLSKPSARFDQKAMRNYMRIELGMSPADIDKAFEAATSLASPAKKVKVLGK